MKRKPKSESVGVLRVKEKKNGRKRRFPDTECES